MHTLAMPVVTGGIAVVIYEWVGLAFLRRGWMVDAVLPFRALTPGADSITLWVIMFFVPVVYEAIGPDMDFTCDINRLSSAHHAIETPPLEAGESVVPGEPWA